MNTLRSLLFLITSALCYASAFQSKPIPAGDVPMNNREVQESLIRKQRTARMYRFAFQRAGISSFEFTIPAYRLREFQKALLALKPSIGFTKFAEQVLDHGLVTIKFPDSFPYRLASLMLPADLPQAPQTAYYGFYQKGDTTNEIVMACALYAKEGLPTAVVNYEAIPAIDYGDGVVTTDEPDYLYIPPGGNAASSEFASGEALFPVHMAFGLLVALFLLVVV